MEAHAGEYHSKEEQLLSQAQNALLIFNSYWSNCLLLRSFVFYLATLVDLNTFLPRSLGCGWNDARPYWCYACSWNVFKATLDSRLSNVLLRDHAGKREKPRENCFVLFCFCFCFVLFCFFSPCYKKDRAVRLCGIRWRTISVYWVIVWRAWLAWSNARQRIWLVLFYAVESAASSVQLTLDALPRLFCGTEQSPSCQ